MTFIRALTWGALAEVASVRLRASRSLPNVETPPRAALHTSTTNSGGGIRTRDLRVMSPTSYQTAPPRNKNTKYTPGRRGCQPFHDAMQDSTGQARSSRHNRAFRAPAGSVRRTSTSSFSNPVPPALFMPSEAPHKVPLRGLRVPAPAITLGGLGTWRSPVAHCNGVAGVAGSNPAVPTTTVGSPTGQNGRSATPQRADPVFPSWPWPGGTFPSLPAFITYKPLAPRAASDAGRTSTRLCPRG